MGNRKNHSACVLFIISSTQPQPIRLLVGLVATDGLGAVKVGVDAGIDLVQHVAVMRASCLGWVSTASSCVVRTMGASDA